METNPRKIVVYYCRNLRLFNGGGQKIYERTKPGLKLVAVPCSGKVEAHHLLKTLAGGTDGALVLACAEKACQYLEGSKRSHKRVAYAREWLQRIGMEPDRLAFIHLPPMDLSELDKVLEEFASTLESFDKIPAAANI